MLQKEERTSLLLARPLSLMKHHRSLVAGLALFVWVAVGHALAEEVSQPQSQQEPTEDNHAADPVEDDRTLLDIFGQVAKEYLTQQVVRAATL